MLVGYARVSTHEQNPALQADALKQAGCQKVFEDKISGAKAERPGLAAALEYVRKGDTLLVWRLDRLGRTAAGLTRLFERLQEKRVRLISLMDNVDLGTASGRLIANVLASVASYETELRGERVKAGQSVAKANGKRWGGAVRGRRLSVTNEQIGVIVLMRESGEKVASISRATGVSRRHVYNILRDIKAGVIAVKPKKLTAG